MKHLIKVEKYIKSGFSTEDAEALVPVIDSALADTPTECVIELDFSNVKFFTTRFFNMTLARLLDNMTMDEYERKIHILNLSEVGLVAYQHSLENARYQLTMSNEERESRARIFSEIMQEE